MISCITREEITVAMAKVKWFGISFTKRGGVESGTTKHKSILWQEEDLNPGPPDYKSRSENEVTKKTWHSLFQSTFK